MSIPQPHSATVYRPLKAPSSTSQNIETYTVLARNVSCFVQPGDSTEAFFYQQRGMENGGVIYTSRISDEYNRNDIWLVNDQQYHVVGIVNGLLMNVYQALNVEQYPEKAKKRLDIEDGTSGVIV